MSRLVFVTFEVHGTPSEDEAVAIVNEFLSEAYGRYGDEGVQPPLTTHEMPYADQEITEEEGEDA